SASPHATSAHALSPLPTSSRSAPRPPTSSRSAAPRSSPPSATRPPRAALRSAPPVGKSGVYREKVGAGRGYLRIGLRAPGVGDPDAAAVRVLAGLLGGATGTRLARALANPEGEALGIDAAS